MTKEIVTNWSEYLSLTLMKDETSTLFLTTAVGQKWFCTSCDFFVRMNTQPVSPLGLYLKFLCIMFCEAIQMLAV